MHPAVRQLILFYPWVSGSPLITAIVLLTVGLWLGSWSFVCIGVASLLYQSWGAAYRRMVVTTEPLKTCVPEVDGRSTD